MFSLILTQPRARGFFPALVISKNNERLKNEMKEISKYMREEEESAVGGNWGTLHDGNGKSAQAAG